MNGRRLRTLRARASEEATNAFAIGDLVHILADNLC